MEKPRREEIFRLHAQFCSALADPKRLLILMELRDGPRTVSELSKALSTRQSNTSQHLAILRDKGVVTAERDGAFVRYTVADTRILRALDLLLEVLASQFERRAAHGSALRRLRTYRATVRAVRAARAAGR